jgi:hypothetical protein
MEQGVYIVKCQCRGEYFILLGDLLPLLVQSKQIFPTTSPSPGIMAPSLQSATIYIPLEVHDDGIK